MIGKTNAQTSGGSGGIKGEKINISLVTNQASHEDLNGVIVTVAYATESEQYTWNGSVITVEIPPYLDYSVSVSSVEGYSTPSKFTSNAIPENSKSIELKYNTTIVRAVMKSNQTDMSDLADATLTINGITLKNGQTAKIATGSTVTPLWSDVENYKKPTSSSVVLSGTSQDIEGTYQTELVKVTLISDDGSSLSGQTVTINGVEHTFDGNAVEQKVAYGVTYSVSTSDKDGYATPEAQTFTAAQSMRNLELTYIASALKVNILSNQENDSTIAVVKATVAYGDTTIEVASGQQVGIPTNTDVTITYPEVEGYKTPEAETFRNSNGGVAQKTGTYYTEIVYISTYADEGTPTGFVTTVTGSDGTVLGSFTTDMGIIAIPSGTTYTVSCSDVDGFETPSSKTYTADSITNARRNIPMEYKKIKSETLTVNVNADDNSSVDEQNVVISVPNGIYIQDIDGKLWTESQWDGAKTPNGIAVVTDNCQFVMALENAYSANMAWSGSNMFVSGITSVTTQNEAESDYDGEAQTTSILNEIGNGATFAPAAYYCRAYTFPNGQKGYLGAMGEWKAVLDNFTAIKSAINKCGGSYPTNMWTSTQYNENFAWYLILYEGYVNFKQKTATSGTARAFTSLTLTIDTQPVTNGKATFQIPYDTEYTVSVDEKSGYTSPASQTYTASQATRTITMTYEAPKVENLTVNVTSSGTSIGNDRVVTIKQYGIANGVYIEDVDGKLWSEAEWDGSVTPNGVAVISDYCEFVIALDSSDHTDSDKWGNAGTYVVGVTSTTNLDEAVLDYDGSVQTDGLVRELGASTAQAAYWCKNFTFPNGKKGYLGAVGEWQAVWDNIDAVNSALIMLGKAYGLNSLMYWSSTQAGANYAWFFEAGVKMSYTGKASTSPSVIPFAPLGKPVVNGTASFSITVGTKYTISLNELHGHDTPMPQTFTAANGTRTVNMQYTFHGGSKTASNGVYVQYKDGWFFQFDYPTNKTPNCVAVVTDNCAFGVALKSPSDDGQPWGEYNVSVDGVTTANSETKAKNDYNGYNNTEQLYQHQKDLSIVYAAEVCKTFTFPNKKKGYLGAVGEWYAVYQNRSAITTALEQCGGKPIYNATSENKYSTSTQYSNQYYWYISTASGTLDLQNKNYGTLIRPFTTL